MVVDLFRFKPLDQPAPPRLHQITASRSRCRRSLFPAANERTFLHWMNMAVTIGSISAAMSGADAAGDDGWLAALRAAVLAGQHSCVAVWHAACCSYMSGHTSHLATNEQTRWDLQNTIHAD